MATVQRWTGAETKALRHAMRASVRSFAARLGIDARTVNKWEARGHTITLRPDTQDILDAALRLAGDEVQARFEQAADVHGPREPCAVQITEPAGGPYEVELLRRNLQGLFASGEVSGAGADDWELTVARHGTATKDRPAAILLGELVADVAELERVMAGCRALSALRRLTKVAANLSGLMCLTLIKLDDRQAFRRWARTARIAANEAEDVVTYSWVLAQEAYGHFYSGNMAEAMNVARHAQAVVPKTPCVGAVLAAALEARALAALGRAEETRDALRMAEALVATVGTETAAPSAFTYNESQLRFHESNALTHLGDTKAAWLAQERALELVAPSDFMDRAFTRLDRAMCMANDGDAVAATSYARDTLLELSVAERRGIICERARQIVVALPKGEQRSPAVRELRDLLMLPPGQEES